MATNADPTDRTAGPAITQSGSPIRTPLIAKTLGDQTMRYIALWAVGVPIIGIVVMKLLGII